MKEVNPVLWMKAHVETNRVLQGQQSINVRVKIKLVKAFFHPPQQEMVIQRSE